MKKSHICLIVLFLILFGTMLLTACNKTKFEISFIVDDEIYDTVSIKDGEAITLPDDPEKSGFTFDGWFFSMDGSEQPLDSNFSADDTLNDLLTVYAKWTVNTYTIEFESSGGSDVADITDEYGAAVTEPTEPTMTGYTFDGWYTDDKAFENIYVFDTMPAKNVTLYAQWTINKYKITFESNGGSDVADITADYGAAVAAPTEPTKTGYSFGGWFEDNNTFQKVYTFGTMPAENLTLYAKWTVNTVQNRV